MNGKGLAAKATLWGLRAFLAAVFVLAAIPKWSDPRAFADSVRSFEILPDPWNARLALTLPVLELLIAAGLLIPWLSLGANALAIVLFGGFIAALGSAWQRGIEVDCGCFRLGDITDQYLDVILMRLLFLLLAIVAFCLAWRVERDALRRVRSVG